MKNLILFILINVSLLANNSIMAQKCGSSLNMQLIQKENPELYNKLLQIETHTRTFVESKSLKSTNTSDIIRIPVVVHVLYNTSSQNISNDQILSQIEVLNEDYRRQNADASNTPSAFASIADDSKIEFFLACVDPEGNATNGITRTQTSLNVFTRAVNPDGTTNETGTRIKFTSLGGRDAWPSDRYLNIWVCNLANNLLGYAQFPGIGQANTDGVVIQYNCFGRIGTLNSTFNKGRTATHEVGHWLNLIHIWGDDDNDNGSCTLNECSGTDNVSDTPDQGERNYGCPSFPKTDCCSPASPGVMFMNFMDYTDDACMNLFTVGQVDRMRALFATGGFRECFSTNTIINDWCQGSLSISGPSYVCTNTEVTFTVNNAPTSYTWNHSNNLVPVVGNPSTFTTLFLKGDAWVSIGFNGGEVLRKDFVIGSEVTGIDQISYAGKNRYYASPACAGELNNMWILEWQGMDLLVDKPDTVYGRNYVDVISTTNPNNLTIATLTLKQGGYTYSKQISVMGMDIGLEGIQLPTPFDPVLTFSPNPTVGETTVSIEQGNTEKSALKSASTENIFDTNTEWELEVYDSMQSLKLKKQKLRGTSVPINTQSWKVGVYLVRVKYKDEILTGKLVVKE